MPRVPGRRRTVGGADDASGQHTASAEPAAASARAIAAAAASPAPVGLPATLHRSSWVPDDGLVSAVAHGLTKINIATHLNGVLTGQVRRVLAGDEAVTDPRRFLGPARDAVADEVARLVTLLDR